MNTYLKLIVSLTIVTAVTATADVWNDGAYDWGYNDNGDSTCELINHISYNRLVVDIPTTINSLSVTSIGPNCFVDCSAVKNLTIPNSVTSIGDGCFMWCGVTNLIIPNSVTSLGNACFANSYIQNISIPSSITTLPRECFASSRLESITIPNSVTNISFQCFSWCSLANISIPDSVELIEGQSFYHCNNLTKLTIPGSVTTIIGKLGEDSAITNLFFMGNAPTITLTNALPVNAIIYYQNPHTGFDDPMWDDYVCIAIPEPAIGLFLLLGFLWLRFKR